MHIFSLKVKAKISKVVVPTCPSSRGGSTSSPTLGPFNVVPSGGCSGT